jgi:hypothetical protein
MAKDSALQGFLQLEAQQSTFTRSSPEHAAAVSRLHADIASWTDKLLDGARKNAQTAAALNRQKESSAAEIQAIKAEAQQQLQQQQQQPAVIHAENEARSANRDSEMTNQMMAMMMQMIQAFIASSGSGGCCGCPGVAVAVGGGYREYAQTATVSEVAEGSSSSRRPRLPGRNARGGGRRRVGITQRGEHCLKCLSGQNCPHEHESYEYI